MDRDVFLAILAMDSYNRGYGSGIAGLSDGTGIQLGNATISGHSSSEPNSDEVSASFYAIAYEWTYEQPDHQMVTETIISYRGTDDIISRRSPDGAERNPGSAHTGDQDPDYAPLYPGYSLLAVSAIPGGKGALQRI
jgi:hypothetical protein